MPFTTTNANCYLRSSLGTELAWYVGDNLEGTVFSQDEVPITTRINGKFSLDEEIGRVYMIPQIYLLKRHHLNHFSYEVGWIDAVNVIKQDTVPQFKFHRLGLQFEASKWDNSLATLHYNHYKNLTAGDQFPVLTHQLFRHWINRPSLHLPGQIAEAEAYQWFKMAPDFDAQGQRVLEFGTIRNLMKTRFENGSFGVRNSSAFS